MNINDIIDGLDGEAKEFLTGFVDTNTANVEKINSLERVNADLVAQRSEWRKNVRDMAPEHAQKEIENLTNQLAEVSTQRDNQRAQYDTELNGLRINALLKEMGIEGQNADALSSIGQLALQGAEYKDGAFVYLNEDGTTRYNDTKPYTVLDKINDLKESEKSYLFKQATGGGFKPSNGNPPPNKPMTDEERVKDLKRRHNIK